MKLEDQFRQRLQGQLSDEKTEIDVRVATDIAEQFAIKFYLWIVDNVLLNSSGDYLGESAEELLEAFKYDIQLLDAYCQGFKDELRGSSSEVLSDALANKAYSLGALHALVGDDIRSVDYLSETEILNMIKRETTR